MPDPHHLREPTGVVAVGLDRPGGQEALGMAGVDADGVEAGCNQVSVQPLGHRAGLQANAVDHVAPRGELVDQRLGLAAHLALPDQATIGGENADGNLVQGDVEADDHTHGTAPLVR